MTTSGDDTRLRIEVARGGLPTATDLAALTVALTAGAGAPAHTTQGSGSALTGWQRAALAEGVRSRRIAERADLAHPDEAP